jgi:hypothetical protein
MIEPKEQDIGRRVVYRHLDIHGKTIDSYVNEVGVITSFNQHYVFVRYGSDQHSKATRKNHLTWYLEEVI